MSHASMLLLRNHILVPFGSMLKGNTHTPRGIPTTSCLVPSLVQTPNRLFYAVAHIESAERISSTHLCNYCVSNVG
jgi:hypothetical protein